MILACVTDEISEQLSEAISAGTSYGITHYELRSIQGFRYPYYTQDIMDKIKELRTQYNISYTAASPGIFKSICTMNPARTMETIYRDIVHTSRQFGIDRIIIFAKRKLQDTEAYKQMIKDIQNFVKYVDSEGMKVCLENCFNTYCCSILEILQLLEDVGLDELRLNWDPGNAASLSGLAYDEGFDKIIRYIDNVHMKDLAFDSEGKIHFVPIGEGYIDFRQLFEKLNRAEYKGCLTIETHCKPSLEAFIKSVKYLRPVLADNTYKK